MANKPTSVPARPVQAMVTVSSELVAITGPDNSGARSESISTVSPQTPCAERICKHKRRAHPVKDDQTPIAASNHVYNLC